MKNKKKMEKMKQVLLLIAFLIAGAIPLQAQTARSEVKILIEIRPEVNYVTHLYTLAELGFSDSTYAAKYGNTLPKAAIDTLQKTASAIPQNFIAKVLRNI